MKFEVLMYNYQQNNVFSFQNIYWIEYLRIYIL